MKNLILTFAFLLAGMALSGQTADHIHFAYDAAGNRTQRHVICLRAPHDGETQQPKSTANNGQPKSEDAVYSQLMGKQQISIFPNPVSGELTVVIAHPEPGSQAAIEVYSPDGKKLLHKSHVRSKAVVDFSEWPPGTYVLKIETNSGAQSWKVVKK